MPGGHGTLVILLASDPGDPLPAEVTEGMREVLDGPGHTLLTCSLSSLRDGPAPAAQRVHGLVLASARAGEDVRAPGAPVLRLGRPADGSGQCSVSVDDTMGGELAVRHLLAHGVRTVAFLTIAPVPRRCAAPLRGARRALRAAGLPATALTTVPLPAPTTAAGRDVVLRLLDGRRPPDAVLCPDEHVTLGAQQALLHRGLSVPGDISLICYGDLDDPAGPLTGSVRRPNRRLGRLAAELLLEECRQPDTHSHRQILLQPRLVIRHPAH